VNFLVLDDHPDGGPGGVGAGGSDASLRVASGAIAGAAPVLVVESWLRLPPGPSTGPLNDEELSSRTRMESLTALGGGGASTGSATDSVRVSSCLSAAVMTAKGARVATRKERRSISYLRMCCFGADVVDYRYRSETVLATSVARSYRDSQPVSTLFVLSSRMSQQLHL